MYFERWFSEREGRFSCIIEASIYQASGEKSASSVCCFSMKIGIETQRECVYSEKFDGSNFGCSNI